jgi:hypothetical protein
MSWADAVTREAAWFTADPPTAFPSAPPLQKVNGGAFDVVQGYPEWPLPNARFLFVYRDDKSRGHDARTALGYRELVHPFVVHLQWPLGASSGRIEDDMQALDAAVGDVLLRIRQPDGDHTHGGAFWSVAQDRGESGFGSNDIDVEYTDPLAAAESDGPLEVFIRYTALDAYAGG